MEKHIKLPLYDVQIDIVDGGGSITSSLMSEEGLEDLEYNAAINGIESLVLAMACEGLDVESKSFLRALETTVEAIGNQY